MCIYMAHSAAKVFLLLLAVRRCVSEWQDCSIAREDHWVPAESRSMSEHMLTEYDRRYTCDFRPGALAATSYSFQSACTSKTFNTTEVKSCLKHRRVIFIGDSLSTQQGDSLLGMLGWHPSFLTLGDPRNWKRKRNAEGVQVPTLTDCWRSSAHYAGQSERCYDMFGSTVTKAGARRLVAKGADRRSAAVTKRPRGGGSSRGPNLRPHRFLHHHDDVSVDVVIDEETNKLGEEGGKEGKEERREVEGEEKEEEEEEEEEESSVHLRMFSRPSGEKWLERAVADFNTTRSSDIFVINFGAHYPDTAEDEEVFRLDTAALLDGMARLGETATVIWREIGPAHFPSVNGTYKNFQDLPENDRSVACCTGTPPLHLERNLWVESYINDNGLADKVKLLKIYRMSSFRGSAHHSCHLAPPADPLDGLQGDVTCPFNAGPIDCLHFSETGVVESWNQLMLNHLCPAVD